MEITFPRHPSPQEFDSPEDAFRSILAAYVASNHRRKVEIVEAAYRYAERNLRGRTRHDGRPAIFHPLEVASIIISEMGLGSTSIASALLHDLTEYSDVTVEEITDSFGPRIGGIVGGLEKISGGIFGANTPGRADNFRKLLLSMSNDIRVVLVKMADRLADMRRIEAIPPQKRMRVAEETLHVFAPLANRLGLFRIKDELEDLCFRFLYPEMYAKIMATVNAGAAHRKEIVEEFVAPVKAKLDAAGYTYTIKARVKSAYSIFKKMEKKKIPLEEIYDIYAVRVIFDNEGDDDLRERLRCWEIYTFFSDGRRLHPDRLRDWTGTPKTNGYRALHLTAMGPDGRWIEVQIRSRRMDEIAELGYAAHWKYKEGVTGETELDRWVNTIKDILANPEPDAVDFLDSIRLNLFSPEIYVFTPKGDIVTLPSGATVLDLAFAIHSQLGIHCIAGKINHRPVPLSHPLESGDQVEIITSESMTPTPEMLDACRTARARSRLRAWLRKENLPNTQSTAK